MTTLSLVPSVTVQSYYGVIDCISWAVHYISVAYLFYKWKFIPPIPLRTVLMLANVWCLVLIPISEFLTPFTFPGIMGSFYLIALELDDNEADDLISKQHLLYA